MKSREQCNIGAMQLFNKYCYLGETRRYIDMVEKGSRKNSTHRTCHLKKALFLKNTPSVNLGMVFCLNYPCTVNMLDLILERGLVGEITLETACLQGLTISIF